MSGIRAKTAVALTCLGLLAAPTAAAADVQFGADPTLAVSPLAECPISCTLFWSNPSVGSDIVPFPATGGSGTVTSVTLPAMPNPGQMQAVVLTTALNATTEPSRPNFICCQVKAVSPPFTVPANQVRTVPLSLHVSATEAADLSKPGDTAFGDAMAISVLDPGASAPLRETGAVDPAGPGGFDGFQYWFPALTAPNGEYNANYGSNPGTRVLARFNLVFDTPPAPGPIPAAPGAGTAAAGPAAGAGLKLGKGAARLGADGRTLGLGTATNPPTATTTQTLTVPRPAAGARAAAAKPKGKPKPLTIAAGKTTVTAGKTVAVTAQLNAKGRELLATRGRLSATLTIAATNPRGEAQTVTRAVTIKPAKKKPASR